MATRSTPSASCPPSAPRRPPSRSPAAPSPTSRSATSPARRLVINIFPSIDTGVCQASVRNFNEKAGGRDDVTVLNVSADLPFAQSPLLRRRGDRGRHQRVDVPQRLRRDVRRDDQRRPDGRPAVAGGRRRRRRRRRDATPSRCPRSARSRTTTPPSPPSADRRVTGARSRSGPELAAYTRPRAGGAAATPGEPGPDGDDRAARAAGSRRFRAARLAALATSRAHLPHRAVGDPADRARDCRRRAEDSGIAIAVNVVAWLVFVADLAVHVWLRPRLPQERRGVFDLAVVVLTAPVVPDPRLRWLADPRHRPPGPARPAARRQPGRRRGAAASRPGRHRRRRDAAARVVDGLRGREAARTTSSPTFGDALWWGDVTLTTVGYGDIVPDTEKGRIAGVFLMVTGLATLGAAVRHDGQLLQDGRHGRRPSATAPATTRRAGSASWTSWTRCTASSPRSPSDSPPPAGGHGTRRPQRWSGRPIAPRLVRARGRRRGRRSGRGARRPACTASRTPGMKLARS